MSEVDDLREKLAQAQAAKAQMRAALELAEWNVSEVHEGMMTRWYCPICGCEQHKGHVPECQLAQALATAGSEWLALAREAARKLEAMAHCCTVNCDGHWAEQRGLHDLLAHLRAVGLLPEERK